MKGTYFISQLIKDPAAIKCGRINIIDAPVSGGKTTFALVTIPEWAGNPERILYLIDTTNGELRLQKNIITTSRFDYALCNYNSRELYWGDDFKYTRGKMPVMTYAGFGAEVRRDDKNFHWDDFDYIICDEMQNLVGYQHFQGDVTNLEAAEAALWDIALEGKTKIVALSATPQKIRERFEGLCYDVPYDRGTIKSLETFSSIPYKEKVETILPSLRGQTGILYTTNIEDMERYIKAANEMGIHAAGFWSTNNKDCPMSEEQLALRETVLEEETIPADIDLLVINAASETCIKIKEENRIVDYMIVHSKNEEVKTQVRGRYHGDLAQFFCHDNTSSKHEHTIQTGSFVLLRSASGAGGW